MRGLTTLLIVALGGCSTAPSAPYDANSRVEFVAKMPCEFTACGVLHRYVDHRLGVVCYITSAKDAISCVKLEKSTHTLGGFDD